MKFRTWKKFAATGLAAVLAAGLLTGCGGKKETNANGEEVVELTWWQIGDAQKDQDKVLEKVNEYTTEKIGVKLKVNTAGWGDYNQKMQVVVNTGDDWDLCFTCSWANNYFQNADKGAFLALDDYIKDTDMYKILTSGSGKLPKYRARHMGCQARRKLGACLCGCLPRNMWINTMSL